MTVPLTSFYLDNDLTIKVAALLRSVGHDAVATRDLNREGASDDEQLLFAAKQDWVFVSHNESDFILLHDAWQRWSAAWGSPQLHAGIIIIPQGMKYGVNWRADQILQALVSCLQACAPVTNGLFRRHGEGWQRRDGKSWVACP